VHGDIKAVNILVNAKGVPGLADFGLSRMLEDTSLWATTASTAPGSLRWMAPELLHGHESTVTTASDVYAYAMTCLVFT
jgi:serine/threonine protein kinase